MKQLVKGLLVAKIGAGLMTSFLAHRKKNHAINSIEQSQFYKIIQRLIHHPKTRRRDGFYKVSYQFADSYGDGTSIEATAEKVHPADDMTVNDSLEILLTSGFERIHIRQTIKERPIVKLEKLPDFLKKGFFSVLHIENHGSALEIEKATKTLSRILEDEEDTTFYLEAERT